MHFNSLSKLPYLTIDNKYKCLIDTGSAKRFINPKMVNTNSEISEIFAGEFTLYSTWNFKCKYII